MNKDRKKTCFRPLASGILLLASVLLATEIHASGATIGGYDTAKIANETVAILEAKGVVNKGEIIFEPKESPDALVVAPEFVRFYEDLGSLLIRKKIIEAEDVIKIEDLAAKSGGLKAGGLNPIVLAAGYLNILSQKGIIEISAAQKILDNARITEARIKMPEAGTAEAR